MKHETRYKAAKALAVISNAARGMTRGVAPAISTAGDLLARHGLVKKRRRRRHYEHPGVIPIRTTAPNDLWTADFRGHFRTRDGIYCYPLTVADQHTCYLLACHGLSQLNVWWVRLGVRHQRIRPASPQENGAHERMHKTLKSEAIRPTLD